MLGEDALETDKFIRSLQFDDVVQSEYEKLSEENKKFVEAYASGINAYVEKNLALPLEFHYLGITFKNWTALDSIRIAKLYSFQMSAHFQLTSLRSGIAQKYGKQLAEKLVPYQADDTFAEQISIIPSPHPHNKGKLVGPKEKTVANTKNIPQTSSNNEKIQNAIPKRSNAWVVSGKYTDTGKPILAVESHQLHHIPSETFIATLKFPNGTKITGSTSAGIPFILNGRNNYLAWGTTMSLIENIDLYTIILSEDKMKYYYNNNWKDLKLKEVTIKIKEGIEVNHTVFRTHHGPLFQYSISPELGNLFS